MRTIILLATLTAALSPIAHADPFDHPWCRYTTSRFDVLSDLPQKKVMQLAQKMETFRQGVQPFIHGERRFDELSVKVVIFQEQDDFRSAMQTPHFTGFMRPSLRQSLLVIGPGTNNQWLTENALHEYTHYLLRNRVDVRIPTWYDEGLASLLSTASIGRRHIVLGKAPERLIRNALHDDQLSLQQVLDTEVLFDLPFPKLSDLYLTSWALMHYISLGTHQTKELEAYLRSQDADLGDALQLPIAELEGQLHTYVKHGRLPRIRLPKPVIALDPVEPHCLSERERDHELAQVMLNSNPKGGMAILERLHAEDPEDVQVLLSLAEAHAQQGDQAQGLVLAQRARALQPEDASAKISVALRLAGTCMFQRVRGCNKKWREAATLLESALENGQPRFDAQLGLGVAYLHRNRPQDALAHLRRAYERAPWAPHINLYLGECYRLLGDSRAKGLLINARNWASAEVTKRLATSALAQLNELDG